MQLGLVKTIDDWSDYYDIVEMTSGNSPSGDYQLLGIYHETGTDTVNVDHFEPGNTYPNGYAGQQVFLVTRAIRVFGKKRDDYVSELQSKMASVDDLISQVTSYEYTVSQQMKNIEKLNKQIDHKNDSLSRVKVERDEALSEKRKLKHKLDALRDAIGADLALREALTDDD